MGDGFSCTGNLLQVLQATPTFSNFLTVSLDPLQSTELCSCLDLLQRLVSPQQILNYSSASEAGRRFVERLGNLEVRSTLLVPDNSGLPENQVSPAPHPRLVLQQVLTVAVSQITHRFPRPSTGSVM